MTGPSYPASRKTAVRIVKQGAASRTRGVSLEGLVGIQAYRCWHAPHINPEVQVGCQPLARHLHRRW